MKKIIIAACLLIITLTSSYGQWYVKKYNVTDINLLSKEQLEGSLFNSKQSLLYSGLVVVLGGLFILGGEATLRNEQDETTSLFEFLIGSEIMGYSYIVLGAGLAVGGIVASISYLGRIGRIHSVTRKNYPSVGSLNISPAIILNSCTRSYCPGVTLTYNF